MALSAVQMAAARATKNLHGPDMCLRNVRECFGLEANGHEPTAYAAWLAEGGHTGANTHYQVEAPANVPGFLCHAKGDPGAGHIVVCAGGGMCWSTDFDGHKWTMDGKMHLVSIASLVAAGFKWLGWSETLEGKRIHAHVKA